MIEKQTTKQNKQTKKDTLNPEEHCMPGNSYDHIFYNQFASVWRQRTALWKSMRIKLQLLDTKINIAS